MSRNVILRSVSASLIGFACPVSALAQTDSTVVHDTEEVAVATDQNRIVIGVGTAVAPVRQGSGDYRVRPIPVIDIRQGWLFANFRDGVGVAPVRSDHVTIGAGVVYLQGYRRRDVPTGVGRLSDGAGARAFAEFRVTGLVTTVGVTKGFAGQTKGVLADAAIAYPVVISDRFTLVPTVGTTWADSKYNDRYFGIDGRQAVASGLARFSPGDGFKDVTATLTARYRLNDRVGVSLTGGAVTLLGDVDDSPLVDRKVSPIGLVSLSYRIK